MKHLRFAAAVVALSAIVVIPLAWAGGLWYGLPIEGQPSYCSGQTGAGTGPTTVCNVTAPAGPTTMTGTELFPSDLNPQGTPGSAGQPATATTGSPQTALVPAAMVASGAYLLTNTGGLSAAVTLTVPNGINNVVLNATGTITDYTLNLPVNPYDGQLVRFATNATITTIHVTSTGGAVAGTAVSVDTPTKVFSPVVPNASTGLSVTSVTVVGFDYLYNLSNNRWFRTQ